MLIGKLRRDLWRIERVQSLKKTLTCLTCATKKMGGNGFKLDWGIEWGWGSIFVYFFRFFCLGIGFVYLFLFVFIFFFIVYLFIKKYVQIGLGNQVRTGFYFCVFSHFVFFGLGFVYLFFAFSFLLICLFFCKRNGKLLWTSFRKIFPRRTTRDANTARDRSNNSPFLR